MPIDPRIPLQGVPFTPPKFDMGETLTTVARLQALDEQRRGQALLNKGNERALSRDDAWQAAMAQVFAPPAPSPAPGLTSGGPPPPPAPQGLTGPPPPSMAGQVPPPAPGQGPYGLTAPPPPQGVQPATVQRAPSDLQSLATATQGLTAPAPPTQRPSQFASLMQPLNMEALQQAYMINPEKTAEVHARHVQMQGQKIAQAEHMTERMYTTLKTIVGSNDPQKAYEVGVQRLRDEGIALPKDLPPTYDPAWGMMTLQSLRTAKIEQAELKLAQEQAELEVKQYTAQTERGKMLNEAQKLGGVRQITGDKSLDAAIAATHPQGVPPGQEGAAIQKAQQYLQNLTVEEKARLEQATLPGRLQVSEAHGLAAARLERTEKPLDGPAATAVAALSTLRAMTDDIAAMYKPEFTGPLMGRTGTAREVGGYMSPEETAFRATVKDMNDILGRLRSGANIPAPEMRNLEALLPSVNDRGPGFQAKLQRFQRALEQTRENLLRVGTTGREQLRQETTPTTPRVGQQRAAPVSRPTLDPGAFQAWQKAQGITGPPTAAMIEQYFQSQGGQRGR